MKLLELEALDGSKWLVPASLIADSYRAYYEEDAPDDATLLDWARNDMNWSDVMARAVRVKDPDPANMDDSWANGKMAVIERDMPPFLMGGDVEALAVATPLDADELAALKLRIAASQRMTAAELGLGEPVLRALTTTVEHYRCTRCGLDYSTDQEKPTCDRGPCPMELVQSDDGPVGEIRFNAEGLKLCEPKTVTPVLEGAAEPAAPDFGTELTGSLAKYLSYMTLPDVNFVLNAKLDDVSRIALRLNIDAEGVSVDVYDGFSDADAVALFMLHTLEGEVRRRDAGAKS